MQRFGRYVHYLDRSNLGLHSRTLESLDVDVDSTDFPVVDGCLVFWGNQDAEEALRKEQNDRARVRLCDRAPVWKAGNSLPVQHVLEDTDFEVTVRTTTRNRRTNREIIETHTFPKKEFVWRLNLDVLDVLGYEYTGDEAY